MKAMNGIYVCNEKACKCTEIIFGGYYYDEFNNEFKIDLSDMKDECYCCVCDFFEGAKIPNNSLQKTNCSFCSSTVERPCNENDPVLELKEIKCEFDKKEKILREEISLLEKEISSLESDQFYKDAINRIYSLKEKSKRFQQSLLDDKFHQQRKDDLYDSIFEANGGGWRDR